MAWLQRQMKLTCGEKSYIMEDSDGSGGDDGSADENKVANNPFKSYIVRNETKEQQETTQDNEESIAEDFFNDPLEYSYNANSCQPIGFNLFVEGQKDWYSGKDWFCCDKVYPRWQDWCSKSNSPQPVGTIWYPAYVVIPSWKRVINTQSK